MKVKVIYDFSVEEIEDFSKDKVQIEMNFGEFNKILKFLDEIWLKELGTELSKKAIRLKEKLEDYDTESIE